MVWNKMVVVGDQFEMSLMMGVHCVMFLFLVIRASLCCWSFLGVILED